MDDVMSEIDEERLSSLLLDEVDDLVCIYFRNLFEGDIRFLHLAVSVKCTGIHMLFLCGIVAVKPQVFIEAVLNTLDAGE